MKIMYFITTSDWGGASKYVYELCKYEIERGNEVYFVTGSKGLLLEKVKELGNVKTFVINSVNRSIDPLNDLKSIFIIRRLVSQIKPDIIHLNSSKAGIIGRLACIGKKTKVIFTVHGWSFTEGIGSNLKKFIYKTIEKSVSRFTDLFICVSEYDKRLGIEKKVLNNKTPVVVIYNGSSKPVDDQVNFSAHVPIRLVMVARFSPQKNQRALIEAVRGFPKDKYHLVFVGEGETMQSCKNLVKSLDLKDNIEFLGFKDDVTKELIENDVCLLITHYEGLPISIIEAMSYGLPIIASDVGGNRELVINNENGYLVNNAKDIQNSITKLINNPDLVKKMGETSYKLYKNKFTISKNTESVNKEYERLLSKCI